MKSASDRFGFAVGDRFLLPQHVESHELAGVLAIAVDHDVVAFARGGPEAVDAGRRQQLLADDAIEQRLRAVVQLARRRAVLRVVEDRRKAPLELPRREEERPVDVRAPDPRAAR